MQNKSHKEIIYGIHPVKEAFDSGKDIDRLLIQKNLNKESLAELVEIATRLNTPIQSVPLEKLNRVTRKNHQGVICFISSIQYASLDHIISESFGKGKSPVLLMLDGITDVRNFGAIARSAKVAGVDALIVPARGSAQINSDAIKTSAGALNYLPVCRENNLYKTAVYLKESGLKIISCSEKAELTIYEADFTEPVTIIVGSEEKGISDALLKVSDATVKIPVTGEIGSLNVSVASGVVMFEIVRQRM